MAGKGTNAPAGSAESRRVASLGRLENGLRQAGDWYLWGPYLSERQWGTVREDYSADGDAWEYFPHDHARSRAYRWGEDGLAGFSDVEQRLCLGSRSGTARDPILKERIFGLTGAQGNHGEDAKEYWWYLDALPSHAWNRWRYHYPQRAFPYERPDRRERPPRQARPGVRAARHRRLRRRPLLDRRGRLRQGRPARPAHDGAGHQRRAGRRDAPRAADGWFRNTWSWDRRRRSRSCVPRPTARSGSTTRSSGELELVGGRRTRRLRADAAVLRERDQHRAPLRHAVGPRRTRRTASTTTSSRGARHGQPGRARAPRRRSGTRSTVAPGATVELRLRLRPAGDRERRPRWAGLRRRRRRRGRRRPTSSTPS